MTFVSVVNNRLYYHAGSMLSLVESSGVPPINVESLINFSRWSKPNKTVQKTELARAIYTKLSEWQCSETGHSFPITEASLKGRISLTQAISLATAEAAWLYHENYEIDFDFVNKWLAACLHLATMGFFKVSSYDVQMKTSCFTVFDLALPFVLLHKNAVDQDSQLQEVLGELGNRLKDTISFPTQVQYLNLRNSVFGAWEICKNTKKQKSSVEEIAAETETVSFVEETKTNTLPMGDEQLDEVSTSSIEEVVS